MSKYNKCQDGNCNGKGAELAEIFHKNTLKLYTWKSRKTMMYIKRNHYILYLQISQYLLMFLVSLKTKKNYRIWGRTQNVLMHQEEKLKLIQVISMECCSTDNPKTSWAFDRNFSQNVYLLAFNMSLFLAVLLFVWLMMQ